MLCTQCGGRLEGNLTICPFCNTRQNIDLSQIHQQAKPRIPRQAARATGERTLSGIPPRELSDSADRVTNTLWGVEILAGILSSIVD